MLCALSADYPKNLAFKSLNSSSLRIEQYAHSHKNVVSNRNFGSKLGRSSEFAQVAMQLVFKLNNSTMVND